MNARATVEIGCQPVNVRVSGLRGPRGTSSGPLGEGSVTAETISDDPAEQAAIAQKIGANDFLQEGPGAQLRDRQEKAREIVNVMDFYQPTDADFTDAFERVIYHYTPDEGPPLDAIEIVTPPGVFILSRQLIPRRQIVLRGAGENASVLKFVGVTNINAVMKGALSFGIQTTLDAYTTNTDGKITASGANSTNGAAWSQVRDLQIQIEATSALDAIWSAALITVDRLYSYRGGIHFTAGNLQTDTAVTINGNCNMSRCQDTTVLEANQDSFTCDGSDANVINFLNCNSFKQARNGYLDASFLGGIFMACHSDSAARGVTSYRGINPSLAQRSVYIGCYAEDNGTGPAWDVETGALIIAPIGATPIAGTFGANSVFAGTAGAGMWASQPITIAPRQADVFGIGDAAHRAMRIGPDGLLLRSGDASLGGIQAGGDGTYLTRDAGAGVVNIMKLDKGAAIANAVNAAAAPTNAEFNALVAKVNAILATMRVGLPNIAAA